MPELFPKADFADYRWADLPDTNHYQEWCTAIRESRQPSTPFGYAGPLTETVLLGNVAYRSGSEIEWDSDKLSVVNAPEAMRKNTTVASVGSRPRTLSRVSSESRHVSVSTPSRISPSGIASTAANVSPSRGPMRTPQPSVPSGDALARLPIAEAMESLNVSNAAAIALYEATRAQKRQG